MAILNNKIHIRRDSIEQSLTCYTTLAECNNKGIPVKVGGIDGYVAYDTDQHQNRSLLNCKVGNFTGRVLTSVAPPRGTEIPYNNGSFTVPSGVSYVTVNCVYYLEFGDYKSSSMEYGCVVQRIYVTSGSTYAGLFRQDYGDYLWYNGGVDYFAGYYYKTVDSRLGPIPADVPIYGSEFVVYKIYVDSEDGSPFVDNYTRSIYKTITGGSLP